MTLLGFSCGMPLPLVFSTTVLWLKELGFSLTALGFISSITLLYALKFIWSPLCDMTLTATIERFGLRRFWIGVSQLGIMGVLIFLSVLSEQPSLQLIIAGLGALGFFSTIQDMSVDAWRIECPPHDSPGTLIALYQVGYRIGLLLSSSLALIIAAEYSWATMYGSMAAVMGLMLVCTYSLGAGNAKPQQRMISPFDALRQLISHIMGLASFRGFVAIILLLSLYRLCDTLLSVVARPLFVDLGYTKKDIGVASAITLYLTLMGSGFGAYLIHRLGLYRCLWIGALSASLSNVAFIALINVSVAKANLIAVLAVDNFCTGIASTALIVLMSGLVRKDFTATHFAVLSSLTVLVGKLFAINTGWFAELYGYTVLFGITVLTVVPVLYLLSSLKNTEVFNQ